MPVNGFFEKEAIARHDTRLLGLIVCPDVCIDGCVCAGMPPPFFFKPLAWNGITFCKGGNPLTCGWDRGLKIVVLCSFFCSDPGKTLYKTTRKPFTVFDIVDLPDTAYKLLAG